MPELLLKKDILPDEEEKEKAYSVYLRFALFAFLGFSLSGLDSLASLSPFAVSFVSGLEFDYCFCAFIGSSVGYFISHSWMQALKYVFALLICVLFRLAVNRRLQSADKPFVCSVVSFCAMLSSSAAYLVLTSLTFETALTAVTESALSLFGTMIFMKARDIPVMSIGIKKLCVRDMLLLASNVCILLMCMSGFTLGSISPARMIAAMLIIFSAQYKGVSLSSIVSALFGLSLCLSPSMHFLFPLYVVSGLVSGIVSPLGQYTTAFSFAMTATIVASVSGFNDFRVFPIVEAVIAAAAYATIPSRWITKVQDEIEKSGLVGDIEIEREACAILERAAENVGEVASIVTKVSQKLDKVINPEINRIFAKMQQNVCFGCTRKTECWNKLFNETAMDIMVIAGIERGPSAKTKLESRCIRPNALIKEIDKYYGDFVNGMASKMKITEMRNIVSEQFSGVSQFLSEIAVQMRTTKIPDSARSRTLKTALNDAEIYCRRIIYYTQPESFASVEASFEEDISKIDRKELKRIIEEITGKSFEREEIAITENEILVIFEEKPKFTVKLGQKQIPVCENKICGDCIGRAYDPGGRETALISDGMGTGSRAAIDATMTAALFEKLLSCGFSFESALKMVNSALMVKSTDESLSTVDAVCINIYTGQTDFYKAGASVSFIRRKKTVTVIEEESMPIGIIRSISPARCTVKLIKGDIVLLCSDGVTFKDTKWIHDELLAWTTNSMDDLAAHIASLALLKSDKTSRDDISVIAIKIQ